jgi:hypothetical protein
MRIHPHRLSVLLMPLFAAACGDESTGAAAADVGSPDATPPAGDGATSEDTGGPEDVTANPCEAAGGLCLGGPASTCTDRGGSVAPSGDAGCVFDDGPGVCCVPPAAQASGDTCASHGGVCAPIAGCNFTQGNFAPPSCFDQGGPGTVCCVPQSVCGPETEACCNDMTTYRPMCDRGAFTCDGLPDTTLKPRAQCP